MSTRAGDQRESGSGHRAPVVYLTSGIFGYLYRFFPIGRGLADRGHVVWIVTASAQAAEHARAEGFEVVHLAGEAGALERIEPASWGRSPIGRLARALPGFALGPRAEATQEWAERAAVTEDADELTSTLARLAPALVMTEAEEHRAIRIVLGAEWPLLLIEDLYSTRPDPNVPFPARSHQIPAGTTAGRARAALRWQRFFAVEAVRRHIERWWVDGNDHHSSLARLAHGVETGPVSRRYLQFYDYRAVPRIRTIAPELALPGERLDATANTQVTGPIVDVDRVVHDVDVGFASRWRRVVERRGGGARVIFVSLGTFLSGLEELTARVIDAAAGLADTEVIVSVGRDAPRWERRTLPDNVAVFGRVPQLDVLAQTDLVVATGGLNTGHEALWFGAPVLNLPVAGIDTPGNAARFAYHGVGRTLVARRPLVGGGPVVGAGIGTEELAAEMALLLDSSAYRHRAARMGERLRAWNGIERAIDAIEEHLDPSESPHRGLR